MNAVVVYSHPVEGSFCSAMRDAAVRGLQAAGHTVSVIDLRKDNFTPVMSQQEWHTYMSRTGELQSDLVSYAESVLHAQILVFVYPTWWSGMPAQLKGWLDRVLVPGVGFSFDEKGKVAPALEHLERIHVVTTYGSPKLYVKLVNDNGRRIVSRALRFTTQKRARVTHQGLYEMDKATDSDRRAFLQRIEQKMAKL